MKTNFFRTTPLSPHFERVGICLWDIGARGGFDPMFAPIAWATDAVGFDPGPGSVENIQLTGDWKSERLLPVAIGGDDGEATLNVTADPSGTSFLEHDAEIGKRYHLDDLFDVRMRETVPVLTIGSAMDEFGVSQPDLLKLDVEGMELAILRSASEILGRVVAVKAEGAFLRQRRDQPLAADVMNFMDEAGFCLVDILDIHRWRVKPWAPDPYLVKAEPAYSRGRSAQCDLIFLREPGSLSTEIACPAMLAAAGLGFFDHAREILNLQADAISTELECERSEAESALVYSARQYGRARLREELKYSAFRIVRLLRSGVFGLRVPPHAS